MRRNGPEYHSADGTCYTEQLSGVGWIVVWKDVRIDWRKTRREARELIRALKNDGLGDVALILRS